MWTVLGILLVNQPASFQLAESPILHLHSTHITFHTFRVIIIQATYPDLRETRDYVQQFNEDQRYHSDIHHRTLLTYKDGSLRFFPNLEVAMIYSYTFRFSHILINP
jgi:hypothetical protein